MPKGFLKYFILSCIGLSYTAYFLNRSQPFVLLATVSILFLLYFYGYKNHKNIPLYFSYILRAIFLFSIPVLSDDFWRFIWDGQQVLNGTNPYLFLPSKVGGSSELLANMNSPNYYSVYPPINQLFFTVAALAKTLTGQLFLLHLIILSAETVSISILKANFGKKAAYLYAFNPLIIIELTGNLHFEAIVIFFLLVSWHFYQKNKALVSGIFYGLAIGTKLIPILLFPIILLNFKSKKQLFLLGLFIVFIICCLPFYSLEIIQNFSKSISLFFQSFEFNPSIYYISSKIGFWLKGYNTIGFLGRALAVINLSIIALISISKLSFSTKCLLVLTCFYLFSTTVHPWYLSLLVLFAAISNFKYPLVWSYTIFLSYFAYSVSPIEVNPYLLLIEYSVVAIFMFKERKNLFSPQLN